MKKFFVCIIVLHFFNGAFSQRMPRSSCLDNYENQIYNRVQTMPEWQDKKGSLQNWVEDQILKNHLTDTVKKFLNEMPADSVIVMEICFVIEKDGLVKNLNLCCIRNSTFLENIYIGPAKKTIEGILVNMPKWKPGQQNGSLVAVEQNMKIVLYIE